MNRNEESVIVHGENNEVVWISEEVQARLCRIMTGVMALITAPIVVAVLLM